MKQMDDADRFAKTGTKNAGREPVAAVRVLLAAALALFLLPAASLAGPYAPAADEPGSLAVPKDDSRIVYWASGWQDYQPGSALDATWRTPEKALGPALGTAGDVVSLGRGGRITLTFEPPIGNGPAWDFAVFENSFSDTYLELAYVEVSSDGVNFFRFPNDSLTANPVGGFGSIDPTNVDGFAGKYRQGFGTPFDLSDVSGKGPELDINAVRFVRLVDVVGDGSFLTSSGDVIYDPYPTNGSAGFDLDAVGVLQWPCENFFAPRQPMLLSPSHGATDVALAPTLKTDAFVDDDHSDCEFHLQTQWQIAVDESFSDASLVIDTTTQIYLTSFTVPDVLLKPGETYYWRARHFDHALAPSAWSTSFRFVATASDPDQNPANGIPDDQEASDSPGLDLLPDRPIGAKYKILDTITGEGPISLELSSGDPADIIEYVKSIDPEDLPDRPAGTRPDVFLMGGVGFRIRLSGAGETAKIVLYFSKTIPDSYSWYKYHPASGWQRMGAGAVEYGSNGRSVKISLTDGGPYDVDGIRNSVIVDPGAMGLFGSAAAPPASGAAGIEGGCFIATAAYGSPMEKRVLIFKEFRDRYLLPSAAGRWFTRAYYRYSPPAARIVEKRPALRAAARLMLTPILAGCYLLVRLPWILPIACFLIPAAGSISHRRRREKAGHRRS